MNINFPITYYILALFIFVLFVQDYCFVNTLTTHVLFLIEYACAFAIHCFDLIEPTWTWPMESKNLLQTFWSLSSTEEEERIEAAKELFGLLKQHQVWLSEILK